MPLGRCSVGIRPGPWPRPHSSLFKLPRIQMLAPAYQLSARDQIAPAYQLSALDTCPSQEPRRAAAAADTPSAHAHSESDLPRAG